MQTKHQGSSPSQSALPSLTQGQSCHLDQDHQVPQLHACSCRGRPTRAIWEPSNRNGCWQLSHWLGERSPRDGDTDSGGPTCLAWTTPRPLEPPQDLQANTLRGRGPGLLGLGRRAAATPSASQPWSRTHTRLPTRGQNTVACGPREGPVSPRPPVTPQPPGTNRSKLMQTMAQNRPGPQSPHKRAVSCADDRQPHGKGRSQVESKQSS